MKQATGWALVSALSVLGCILHDQKVESNVVEEPTEETCEIPHSFTPITTAGVPEIESAEPGIEVDLSHVSIELGDEGRIIVRVKTRLIHRGLASAVVKVGYLLRVPDGLRPPIEELSFYDESQRLDWKKCTLKSRGSLIQPYTDEAEYVTVTLRPGETSEIELSFTTIAKSAGKPSKLFGYHDVFALNWKNWDWPYTKSPIFEEIKDNLELFNGIFSIGKAASTTVNIRVTSAHAELRGLSHEQNLSEFKDKKRFCWTFTKEDQVEEVEFEYVVNASFDKEMEVFSLIAKERPGDLRAYIHLSNLYFLNKNPESRIQVLNKLLTAWGDNAEHQLLSRRNDARPAAYVGLVRSLLAIGESQEAKKEALNGVALIQKLRGALGDAMPKSAKPALTFLEKHAK